MLFILTVITSIVTSILVCRFLLPTKNSRLSTEEHIFSYNDLKANQHYRRCSDVCYLCSMYNENPSYELERVIIGFFHEILMIERGPYWYKIRESLYFSTDLYIKAISSIRDAGLEKKYHEVYDERF